MNSGSSDRDSGGEAEPAIKGSGSVLARLGPEYCKGGLCDQVFIGEPACEPGECWAREWAALAARSKA